jgi:hypothetical protein
MADRAANAATARMAVEARELVELPLGRSYRTAQPVLDFVDAAVEAIGPQALGLSDAYEKHEGDRDRPGLVRLWQPVARWAMRMPIRTGRGTPKHGSPLPNGEWPIASPRR